MDSTPSHKFFQYSSVVAAPGNRHDRPIIATSTFRHGLFTLTPLSPWRPPLESLIESFMERLSQVFMRRVLSDRTNYLWRFQRPEWIWPWGLLDWLQRAR